MYEDEVIDLKLLYWNLNSNNNESYVKKIIEQEDLDIVILSEYRKTDLESLVSKLNYTFNIYNGYGVCDKVVMLAKKNIKVWVNREQSRYTIYSINDNNQKYIIVGVHLPSNPLSDSNDRKMVIRDILEDLMEQEGKDRHDFSIIIGDMNACPFDDELICKDGFNAVLYKKIIQKNEFCKYQGKKLRYLYNPALRFWDEENEQCGSFYYTSTIKSLFWYCYDQILMSKALIDSFKSMKFCNYIGGECLLKDIRPNKEISDHLALVAEFERG